MHDLLFVFDSGPRRRSRRRGPDGQEMRNLSKGVEVSGGLGPPHWSDDEGDLPPAKRARDNGYASDHTAVTDYDDMWAHHVPDTRNVILTPPSMVIIQLYQSKYNAICTNMNKYN